MQRLRIDRLTVRLRGISRDRAGELAAELPRELLNEVRRRVGGDRGLRGNRRIGEVRVPAVRLASGSTARQASEALSTAAAGAVRERIETGGGED